MLLTQNRPEIVAAQCDHGTLRSKRKLSE